MRAAVIGASLVLTSHTMADPRAHIEKVMGKAFTPAAATPQYGGALVAPADRTPVAGFPMSNRDKSVAHLRGEIVRLEERGGRVKAEIESVRSRIYGLQAHAMPSDTQNWTNTIVGFGCLGYGLGATFILSLIYRFFVNGNGQAPSMSTYLLDGAELQSSATIADLVLPSCGGLRTAALVMSEGKGFGESIRDPAPLGAGRRSGDVDMSMSSSRTSDVVLSARAPIGPDSVDDPSNDCISFESTIQGGAVRAFAADPTIDSADATAAVARRDFVVKRLEAWLDDEEAVEKWLEAQSRNLAQRLNKEDGIVCLSNFFPNEVAEGALAVLEQLPPATCWEVSDETAGAHAAQHSFSILDLFDVPELVSLHNVFERLVSGFHGEAALPIFSIGRYSKGDFIDEHDDVDTDNILFRTVAGIWYLTKDWSEADGGCLMDLEAPPGSPQARIVPTFNTLVVFKVPHLHAVAPVLSNRIRYSIFGWWHEKGIQRMIKALHEGDEDDQEEAAGALCSLVEHEETHDEISEHGGIQALVKLLHEGSMTAKENAAIALGTLADSGINKVAIRRAGGIKPLLALLREGSEEAQSEAKYLLLKLEEEGL